VVKLISGHARIVYKVDRISVKMDGVEYKGTLFQDRCKIIYRDGIERRNVPCYLVCVENEKGTFIFRLGETWLGRCQSNRKAVLTCADYAIVTESGEVTYDFCDLDKGIGSVSLKDADGFRVYTCAGECAFFQHTLSIAVKSALVSALHEERPR